ncbi:fimbrial biogenesis outer membrane usher protein [Klebsiella pneumoniae]|nr:fimbrial biogenesis outer membrane usher protein [Klebsiella pneumoniae]MTW92443.1 fimbria/pilus outer membrane usher protein [Klebsiella pneumoniae]
MCNLFRLRYRFSLLTGYIALVLSVSAEFVEAKDYFNPELLEFDGNSDLKASLSTIGNGHQLPGIYHVDIFINNEFIGTKDIDFRDNYIGKSNKDRLTPCFSYGFMKNISVNMELFPNILSDGECVNLSLIPDSSFNFDFTSQRLSLTFPQSAMIQNARGLVPVEQWDEGLTVFLMNYNLSGSVSKNNKKNDNIYNNYMNLRPGFNIGPWRQRNYITYYQNSSGEKKWDRIYSYLQRDIPSFSSQLVLGDSTSQSDVFDSVPFRGFQLYSDIDMLPDSLKGYAPIVRGIAKTNALVVIRQNGYIIYQTRVSPGAFILSDLYPTGGSGDLDVRIKETDGSEQYLVIPYASLPVLQRQGKLKYNVVSGAYRSYNANVASTKFNQLSLSYGLPWGNTIYGGFQLSEPYKSYSYGIGQNLGEIGAVSLDLTNASSKKNRQRKTNGNSYRVRYSKNFVSTGTNFTIAGYRYSTNGYNTLQEVMSSYTRNQDVYYPQHVKEKAEVTVNQNFNSAGAVTLNYMRENLLGAKGSSETMGVGYSNTWATMSYSVNFSRSKNNFNYSGNGYTFKNVNNMLSFNLNIPFDLGKNQSFFNYTLNTGSEGKVQNLVGINGSSFEERNLNWNIQKGFTSDKTGDSSNINVAYRGTYGEFNTGYGYTNSTQTFNYGVSGGVLLHRNGMTLGQQLGETLALVKIPGASGLNIMNQVGVKTDIRGYAVVPYLSPFKRNQITLDANNLPYNVDIKNSTKVVVPTRGAVVLTEFHANVGERALINLKIAGNHKNVPFGAVVKYENNSDNWNTSIVGDNGQVYLTGVSNTGSLTAQWGPSAKERCSATYDLSKLKSDVDIFITQAICR